jgi:copper(I)-binding protein
MKRLVLAAFAMLLPIAAFAESVAGQAVQGDIAISGGFTRAMLPNQPVGGGYLTIRNSGAADRLLGVATPLAQKGELHEMSMKGEVMSMRPLPDGVAVPARGTVALEPGGLHMMFTGVTAPFKVGDTVPVTLRFEKAGTVEVVLPVLGVGQSPNAGDAEGDAMPGMGHMPGMNH